MNQPAKGWLCPSCGRAHAPHVETCPVLTITSSSPYEPPMVKPVLPADRIFRTPAAPGWVPPSASDNIASSAVRFGVGGAPLPIISH